ncbi:MAG: DNA recombination protein RmuC [Deltaproteobacteria bacterium]|nr:MAG: DNA recombination protein RmuC [Deltaproteobacteria bacterium]
MECLSGFKTEWEKFSAEVDRHGKQLATAQKSFDSLAGTRSNQLQRQLNRIDELQVARESDDDEETGAELSEWPPLRGVASA